MTGGTAFFDWQADLDGLSVADGAFVVVTAEGSDHAKYDSLAGVLRRIRRALGLDVAFVSLFIGAQPQVRYAEDDASITCDPLEEAFGRQLFGDGDVMALPVVGRQGWIYGTLCCRVQSGGAWDERPQLHALESVARLLATSLDEALEPLTSGFVGLVPLMPSEADVALAA